MENLIILVTLATILFVLAKMIQMKFIDKELKPLKFIVQDAGIVAVSTAVGAVLVEILGNNAMAKDLVRTLAETPVIGSASTQVFTDNPGF